MKPLIGMCHGCFDLLHCGHILHFEEAYGQCDFLIVSVTADKFASKQSGRPIYSLKERMLILSSIKYVDKVIESSEATAVSSLLTISPGKYFKGVDYLHSKDPRLINEKKTCNEINCEIIYTKSPKFSTTNVIKACQNISL